MNRTQLDTMFRSYVDCALWADGDDKDDEYQSFEELGLTAADLEPSAAGYMARDVEKFVASLDERELRMATTTPGTMGHYLWLTKQGHGDGFWASPGTWHYKEDSLTAKAQALGECYLYLTDDGKIGLAQ